MVPQRIPLDSVRYTCVSKLSVLSQMYYGTGSKNPMGFCKVHTLSLVHAVRPIRKESHLIPQDSISVHMYVRTCVQPVRVGPKNKTKFALSVLHAIAFTSPWSSEIPILIPKPLPVGRGLRTRLWNSLLVCHFNLLSADCSLSIPFPCQQPSKIPC